MRTKHLSRRFDEAVILASLAKVAFTPEPELTEDDFAVLAALRRSSPDWDLTLEETGARLAQYSDDQIAGLVNNIKGILHEMEFVQLENDDGDSVVAALYPDTNHKSVDVQMLDLESGEAWSVQLKATDDLSAINDWMDSNPDAEILVTEELSERMDLPSSGFSNEELTIRVEDFVDRLVDIEASGELSLWDSFPPMVAASTGIVVFELWRRYRAKELSAGQFRVMAALVLGVKAGEYAAILMALSVPGINVIVGAYLLGSLVFAASRAIDSMPSVKPFATGWRRRPA